MKSFITKKIAIGAVLIMIMCFNSVGVSAICDELKGESILHAWCWSFKTIKENMGDIAAAGYKAVQVSPPQECAVKTDCPKCRYKRVKVITKKNGQIIKETHKLKGCKHFTENWYMHYQPTNFKIGNDQLGTKKEFQEMCQEAERKGVKIIVDVVANHVAKDLNQVSDDIKNINEVFHGYGDVGNAVYWCRENFTQSDFLGLKDLNTHNKGVQKMIMDYMNDCLKCGVWGFRYDAAQHIELPKEIDKGFGSDFWPNILDNSAGWQYGEVWQYKYSRFSDYAKYMDVTAMNYGQNVRDAICRKDLGHWNFTNYDANGVDPDKLVTWVESHDNYAGSDKLRGASSWMSDEEVKAGWAIVASRKAGVPMFFSRPDGSGGRNKPKFSEQTKLGDKGSDLFKDRCVVAVNKFRRAMKDQDEYLRSQNNKTIMIERGNKGMVIVNWSENQEINSETRLADGTYVDRASDTERKFEVRNGRIYGNTWGANSGVVVLTRADEPLA